MTSNEDEIHAMIIDLVADALADKFPEGEVSISGDREVIWVQTETFYFEVTIGGIYHD